MERDYLKSLAAQEYGKGGGNPNLRRQDNQTDNARVNPTDIPHGGTCAPGHFQIQKEDSVLRTPVDPKVELWRTGLATLSRLTGRQPALTRKFLGKLLDLVGGDHERLLTLIARAE